jgi:hypothetical protein
MMFTPCNALATCYRQKCLNLTFSVLSLQDRFIWRGQFRPDRLIW